VLGAKVTDRVTTLDDLQHDPENARVHDDRNLSMIKTSLEEVGAWRSIGIDEGNIVFMGNGVIEAAKQAGISKVRVVEASGDEIIAVRRRGLTAEQKRFAALADNRASDLSSFNPSRIAALAEQGTVMEDLFTAEEMAAILSRAGDGILASQPREYLSDGHVRPDFSEVVEDLASVQNRGQAVGNERYFYIEFYKEEQREDFEECMSLLAEHMNGKHQILPDYFLEVVRRGTV